jgi:hypothetical protein
MRFAIRFSAMNGPESVLISSTTYFHGSKMKFTNLR